MLHVVHLIGGDVTMIKAAAEHEAFLTFISHPECPQVLAKSTRIVRSTLHQELSRLKNGKDIKAFSFINWILTKSEEKFYLTHYADKISLIDIHLNSMMVIRYCYTITKEAQRIFNDTYKHAIEIVGLHSNKKGEGTRLINEVIAFSKEIDLPLVLYAETDELASYYEQFHFLFMGN